MAQFNISKQFAKKIADYLKANRDLIINHQYEKLILECRRQSEVPEKVMTSGVIQILEMAGIDLYKYIDYIPANAYVDRLDIPYYKVPSGIKEIGQDAFKGCIYLSKVKMPTSITDIHIGAFDGCDKLNKVEYDGTVEQFKQIRRILALPILIEIECSDGTYTIYD